MSSYDKVVKLACKPKAAPPKAKYLDPIIAATWSEDGAVHDVCKALSPRFREPNAIIVFKALIVLHTMIRNGATDNVLTYLSSGDVLRLRNVANGQWEGYDTPQNLAHYAFYLDSRVRAYGDLKHDAVRVQSESNRDMRVSQSIELGRGNAGGPKRSKTMAGRKLRSMTVEKGLLRETKAVHRMIDTLLECKFYLDDLEDELTITALRMLVKDLLVLFQAGNEGVINVLEHYFEMSHIDAEDALAIYRHFCKQTEQVVEYLGVAKKLQNLLSVPIPNLKHAPVSLVGALEEYLKDPNFEQNRLEYRANRAAADSHARAPSKPSHKADAQIAPTPSSPPAPKSEASPPSSSAKAETNQTVVDFFSSIEAEQRPMFDPNSRSPSSQYPQQQAPTTFNPFIQQQSMGVSLQMTGTFPQQSFVQGQQTGFLVPQNTAFQTSPFPQVQQQQQEFAMQPSQHQGPNPFPQQHPSPFLQPQPAGLLRPQATGSNPFRQSMAFSQPSTVSPFAPAGMFGAGQGPSHPQSANTQGISLTGVPSALPSQSPSSPFTTPAITNGSSPFAVPTRPQSTPIPSQQNSAQALTTVVTHRTGTKNPFGVPVEPAPPVPKPPTLQELSMSAFGAGGGVSSTLGSGSVSPPVSTGQAENPQEKSSSPRAVHQTLPVGSTMASVASSFASKPAATSASAVSGVSPSNPFPGLVPQYTTTMPAFSAPLSNTTGTTAATVAPSSPSQIQPQQTGFGGIKPFKPSSSFGASLLDSLPPISASPPPSSGPYSPTTVQSTNSGVTGMPPTNTPGFSFNPAKDGLKGQQPGAGALNAQQMAFSSFSAAGITGPSNGLRPQTTGGANPFRASMMNPSASMPSFAANSQMQSASVISTQSSSQQKLPSGATGAPLPFSSLPLDPGGQPSSFGTFVAPNDASNKQNGSFL